MKQRLLVCALLTISCTGILDGEQEPFKPSQSNVGGTMSPGGGGTSSGGGGPRSSDTPFGVRIGEPELLPFDVRVRRISNVLGVPVTNAMFTDMHAQRIQLGDYDHAKGALPEYLWLARRISTWADALTPVCSSSEMKAQFPALPGDAGKLIKAAWGREATAEELVEINTAVSEAALAPAESYEATCMAIFTAGEFVFR